MRIRNVIDICRFLVHFTPGRGDSYTNVDYVMKTFSRIRDDIFDAIINISRHFWLIVSLLRLTFDTVESCTLLALFSLRYFKNRMCINTLTVYLSPTKYNTMNYNVNRSIVQLLNWQQQFQTLYFFVSNWKTVNVLMFWDYNFNEEMLKLLFLGAKCHTIWQGNSKSWFWYIELYIPFLLKKKCKYNVMNCIFI